MPRAAASVVYEATGTQTAFAGSHDGFLQTEATPLEDDRLDQASRRCRFWPPEANANDGAEKGDDVERRSANPKTDNGPDHCQHGSEHDCNRLEERTKFDEEDGENQEERHQEHDEKISERLLLLLVKAPIFDRSGGYRLVGGELRADFRHRAAQIPAFEAAGNRDVLPQIFAVEFNLARLFLDVGHLAHAYLGPARTPNDEVAQCLDRGHILAPQQDPDVDDAISFLDMRGDLPQRRAVLSAAEMSLLVRPKRLAST